MSRPSAGRLTMHLNFNIIFLLFCQLYVTYVSSLSVKYPPTKGEVWPAPQIEKKSETVYTFRSSKLRVTVLNNSCDIITNALQRYNLILRDYELFQNYKYLNEFSVPKEREDEYVDPLKELIVDLSSECETTPHFEMNEIYSLTVSETSILKSGSVWGILRGLETFVQLFYFSNDFSEILINATTIEDYPQYKHRGLLIDTGRHYLSLSTIYKTIEAMAMNKMNVLHWHIVDDQSFPYQSRRFPDLSEKGAFFPSMVYTKADIYSVVAFARDRGIRVIPEIDVPGHTRSWGEAMPSILTECYKWNKVVDLGPLDPTKDETYEVLQQLFQEVARWFPDEFLHVGGDEVKASCWASNPHVIDFVKNRNMTIDHLQGYFMKNTLALLPARTRPIVWQEVFDMNALPDQKVKTYVQVWKYEWIEEMDRVLKAGHYVIFSSAWYLDEYLHQSWEDFYKADPRQMVYNLNNTTSGLEDIVGGEACMWGEMVDDTNILSVSWPRASAIAERLWTGLDYTSPRHLVNDTVRRRIEEHACRMNRRGIPAKPPNGPSFCVGAPPPLQKTFEVHNV